MGDHFDDVVADRLEEAGRAVGYDEQPVAGTASQALDEEPGRRRGPDGDGLGDRERQQMGLRQLRRDDDHDPLRAGVQLDVGLQPQQPSVDSRIIGRPSLGRREPADGDKVSRRGGIDWRRWF